MYTVAKATVDIIHIVGWTLLGIWGGYSWWTSNSEDPSGSGALYE